MPQKPKPWTVPEGSLWEIIGPAEDPRQLMCRCKCGKEKAVFIIALRYGRSKSCGKCGLSPKEKKTKHGRARSRIYQCWAQMKQRCSNESDQYYHNYGGRGITVCARWGGTESFPNFLADMGEPPGLGLTVDRIDGTKGYWCGKAECPECGPLGRAPNCRWATRKQQARNTRVVKPVTHNGETKPIGEWAEQYGLPYNVLQTRLANGWDFERAVSEPVHRNILDIKDVLEIKKRWNGFNAATLAREFGVGVSTVGRIVRGEIQRYEMAIQAMNDAEGS
jgi:hypothetical protein